MKVDDYLDAISHYKTPNSGICQYVSGWCKAKVVVADNDILLLQFIGRQQDVSVKVSRDSVEIAPPGTYTDDMEWRNKLKRGSLLDCCDDYGVWYRSSVLNIYESDK